MAPLTRRRVLVGRRFGKWTIAISVSLMLIAAHTAWDFIEARRLLKVLAETTDPSARAAQRAPQPEPSAGSAQFYLAAAALAQGAGPERVRVEINRLLGVRENAAELPAETLVRIREFLDDQADAFRLLDRATSLPFTGFSPRFPAEWTDLRLLEWLCNVRSAHAALSGDGEAATASLVAELALDGGPNRPMTPLWPFLLARRTDTIRTVQTALDRTRPSAPALARLAAALQEADDDDEWARYFARQRDRDLESERMTRAYGAASGQVGLLSAGGPSWFKLWRPLSAREWRRQLAQYERLLSASRSPWPGRIEQVLEVTGPARSTIAEGYLRFLTSANGWLAHPQPEEQRRQLHSSALDLAGVRAARVAVAIERYRRAHAGAVPGTLDALVPAFLDGLPIDPFFGGPIRYRATGAEYVVYSVGVNRKDENGEQAKAPPWTMGPSGSEVRSTGDIGMRVALGADSGVSRSIPQ